MPKPLWSNCLCLQGTFIHLLLLYRSTLAQQHPNPSRHIHTQPGNKHKLKNQCFHPRLEATLDHPSHYNCSRWPEPLYKSLTPCSYTIRKLTYLEEPSLTRLTLFGENLNLLLPFNSSALIKKNIPVRKNEFQRALDQTKNHTDTHWPHQEQSIDFNPWRTPCEDEIKCEVHPRPNIQIERTLPIQTVLQTSKMKHPQLLLPRKETKVSPHHLRSLGHLSPIPSHSWLTDPPHTKQRPPNNNNATTSSASQKLTHLQQWTQ